MSDIIKRITREVFASFLIAAGVYNFAIGQSLPITGFTGIALIFNRLFNIPPGIFNIILNIPVTILCYKLLGKNFLYRSLVCMLISSLMMDYVAPLFPMYKGDRILGALCTGIFSGIGYGMIFMENSSTGGVDFITLSLKKKKPYISIGRITFIIDMIPVVAGGIIFNDFDGIILGIMVNYLIAYVIDKYVYGVNSGRMVIAVTKKAAEVSKAIGRNGNRGTTVVDVKGGHTGEEKKMIICACGKKEVYFIQKIISDTDREAFSVILESNEVHGEGFKRFYIGEKE